MCRRRLIEMLSRTATWNGYPRHCQWMNSGPGGNLVEMADESPDGKLAWGI